MIYPSPDRKGASRPMPWKVHRIAREAGKAAKTIPFSGIPLKSDYRAFYEV
jgi:hypothetical protein